MPILDSFKKKVNKPNLVFPQVIEDSKLINDLDRAFDNRNAYWISVLYKKAAKDSDILNAQSILNEGLKEKRDLSKEDINLITNIVKAYNECEQKYVIFESIGNLIFISEVLDELKKNSISDKIKMVCFLWLYQNMIEVIYAHLSEIFYVIARKRNHNAFLKEYEKIVQKEEHLMRQQLLNYARNKKNKFTDDNKDTLLHHRELRNRLAHANCFFDTVRNEVILSSNKRLTINNFKKEFQRVRDFLYELIAQLNNNNSFDLKKDIIKLANKYFRMSRDPIMNYIFKRKDIFK